MVLTLDELLNLGLSANEKLRAAGYGVEAAKGQLQEAKARGWPIIEYEYWFAPVPRNASTAVESFFSGDVTVWNKGKLLIALPLYAFGQLTTVRKLAEGGVVAAKHRVVQEREEVIYNIKALYYGILFGYEMEKLLDKAIGSLTNKIENEEEAEEQKHSPFDLLKMKVFREELARRLDETKEKIEMAYEGMRVQTGLPPGTKIRLNRKTLDPEVVKLGKLQQYVNASLEHRPESNLIDIGVETKRKMVKLEKQKMAPRIGFGFYFELAKSAQSISGLANTDDFNNPFNFTRAGLGFRLDGKLDIHGALGRIKKAQAEYLKSLYEGRMGKKGIALDARKAYEESSRLLEKVKSTKKSHSMSNQMMFLSKSNYELGIGDQEEYAEALQLLLANRGLYFKSILDYNVSLANLERKVGHDNYARLTGRPKISVYDAFDVGDEGGWDEFSDE
jgi:outer membrane protein TolC